MKMSRGWLVVSSFSATGVSSKVLPEEQRNSPGPGRNCFSSKAATASAVCSGRSTSSTRTARSSAVPRPRLAPPTARSTGNGSGSDSPAAAVPVEAAAPGAGAAARDFGDAVFTPGKSS